MTVHRQKYRIHIAWILFSLCTPIAAQFLAIPSSAYAQMPTPDSLMSPKAGEKSGELVKGQLFVTTLKNENLDNNSVKLAMQSIGKLFDFRLSRAGDRYLYKAGPNRKLLLLRYQRAQHVYEAVLNQETGEYDARVIETAVDDVPPPPPIHEEIPIQVQNQPIDDDGEIDVEREGAYAAAQVPGNGRAEVDNFGSPNDMDVASPDDPIQPVDAALVGKNSPDEEFPERPGFVPVDDEPGLDEHTANLDSWREENLRDEKKDNIFNELYDELENTDEVPEIQNLPGTSAPVVQPNIPIQIKRVEHESVTFSTISIVLFGLGSCMFIFALAVFVLPAILLRRRCKKLGLRILDLIQITPTNKLARVAVDGQACIIGIHPGKMSFIAPCPLDDESLWQHIKSKSFWYKMAQKPVSDRQMAAIIQAFANKSDKEYIGYASQIEIDKSSSHSSTILQQEDITETGIFDDEEDDEAYDEEDEDMERSGMFSESDIDEDAFFSKK